MKLGVRKRSGVIEEGAAAIAVLVKSLLQRMMMESKRLLRRGGEL